jgi:hypothetical protein
LVDYLNWIFISKATSGHVLLTEETIFNYPHFFNYPHYYNSSDPQDNHGSISGDFSPRPTYSNYIITSGIYSEYG